jgi:hypothetical protein
MMKVMCGKPATTKPSSPLLDEEKEEGPVVPGPNSVPNTQPPHPPDSTSLFLTTCTQVVVLGDIQRTQQPHYFIDIPPLSTHPETNVLAMGFNSSHP